MQNNELQQLIVLKSNLTDQILGQAFQTTPSFSVIQEGWFRKEYPVVISNEEKTINALIKIEIHHFNNSLGLQQICLSMDATTPKPADGLESTLFKCRADGTNQISIEYKPELSTMKNLISENAMDFVSGIGKFCADILINLQKGVLRQMVVIANQ